MTLLRNRSGYLVRIKTTHADDTEPVVTSLALSSAGLDMLSLLLSGAHQLPVTPEPA